MGGYRMNRRVFVRNLLGSTAGVTLGMIPVQAWSKEDMQRLTILHTNDLHAQIEPFEDNHPRFAGRAGFARISGYVKSCRSENPNLMLVDAGDFFQGTPYFNFFGGELILKLMTGMGYDAGTIGNHEFDNGLQGLHDPVAHAGFPLINSNYDFSDTILNGLFPRFRIFNKNGIRVGVYGLGIELRGLVNEKQHGNVRYNEPLATALEMEKYLAMERRCDLVVCLSHLGLRYQNDKISDLALAPLTSYTDVIIGGHTHSQLEEPILVANNRGEMVVVNQAHYGGLMVGRLDFIFERKRGRNRSVSKYHQQSL